MIKKSSLPHQTRPRIGMGARVDASVRSQVATLITEIHDRVESVQAEVMPDINMPCEQLKERLDQKRQELQKHLETIEKLKHLLLILEAVRPPVPNEWRLRVLILRGSIYDFTRLGKSKHRERLDHALHNCTQILKSWGITIVLGKPEIIEKRHSKWRLTPETLQALGDTCASPGTPVLLFADHILLPDKTLPSHWAEPSHFIACVTDREWLNGGQGLITTQSLGHLLDLEEGQIHDLRADDTKLSETSPQTAKQLQRRIAKYGAHWIAENAAVRQRGDTALALAEQTVTLLEEQGDMLWQRYQTCLERGKDTPTYGIKPLSLSPSVSSQRSDLVHQVERLTRKVARLEQELAIAQTMLSNAQTRLRELDDHLEQTS